MKTLATIALVTLLARTLATAPAGAANHKKGVEREWPAALVNATNLIDIGLSGAGTIDGSGD
jgi:hypothetical protein